MANLKDIKSRIQSIENTKKITRAMKMVAAAKVKKSENAAKSTRAYSDALVDLFKKLISSVGSSQPSGLKFNHAIENYPQLLTKREIKTVGILAITSNKGLAGAYNANIVKNVLKAIKKYKDEGLNVKLFIIGQKGFSGLKRKAETFNVEIVKTYTKVINEVSPFGAEGVAEDLADNYISGNIDKVEVFTTKFRNMMSYSPENWDLIPVSVEIKEKHTVDPLMEFEPSQEFVLQKLMPMYLTNTIYHALLEAQASELASRMTAMSAASNNAEDMIRTLTVDYNKARQWAITQEILEVVSGADALKG
jgi:F-type H+-transporting ATPase subunit gamma